MPVVPPCPICGCRQGKAVGFDFHCPACGHHQLLAALQSHYRSMRARAASLIEALGRIKKETCP